MAEPSDPLHHTKPLDHIRAARKSLQRRPTPTEPPAATQRPAAKRPPPPAVDTTHNPAASTPTPTPAALEPDSHSTIERLAASIDALTAKYEMEQAAHRQTLDQLIQQQQAHIETLQRLLDQRSDTDA